MPTVSVLIPTFRRPEPFRRAAASVFAQSYRERVELVAVDNSPEGSALSLFQALERVAPMQFRWAHEPRPGVANARNAALALASGDFVAWLDDDETAPPGWLEALVRVRRETGAQSVFGPVRAMAQGADKRFYENLYSRKGPRRSGLIAAPSGIGNSLQPRSLFDESAPFCATSNETGGEDDLLFASWRAAGATFAWAADAEVIEHIGPERLRLSHGLKRAFAYGQGPCELAWSARDYFALARHMWVGAGQAAVFGAAAACLFATGQRSFLPALERSARGAGKMFWFRTQKFYGEALARSQLA